MSSSYPANGTTFFNSTGCNGNLVPSGAAAGWCLKQDGDAHPTIDAKPWTDEYYSSQDTLAWKPAAPRSETAQLSSKTNALCGAM
jgi:hypothetical protein